MSAHGDPIRHWTAAAGKMATINDVSNETVDGIFNYITDSEDRVSTRLVSRKFRTATDDASRRDELGVLDFRAGHVVPLSNPLSADCIFMTDDLPLHHRNLILLCDDSSTAHTAEDGIVSVSAGQSSRVSRFDSRRVMKNGKLDQVLLDTCDKPLGECSTGLTLLGGLEATTLFQTSWDEAQRLGPAFRDPIAAAEARTGTASVLQGRYNTAIQVLDRYNCMTQKCGLLVEHVYPGGPSLGLLVTGIKARDRYARRHDGQTMTNASFEAAKLLEATQSTGQQVSVVMHEDFVASWRIRVGPVTEMQESIEDAWMKSVMPKHHGLVPEDYAERKKRLSVTLASVDDGSDCGRGLPFIEKARAMRETELRRLGTWHDYTDRDRNGM